jgi:hypothetical protein
VVYIGQGGNLRRRLTQLYRFGSGMPVGHWGGRYLWQLRDADALRIAWRVEPDPRGAEVALIAGFVVAHGSLPFANLRQAADGTFSTTTAFSALVGEWPVSIASSRRLVLPSWYSRMTPWSFSSAWSSL